MEIPSRWITLALSAGVVITSIMYVHKLLRHRAISTGHSTRFFAGTSSSSTQTDPQSTKELSSSLLSRLAPSRVPVCNQVVYSHGGFMGAAVECVRHMDWLELIRRYTPKSFQRLRQAQFSHTLTSTTIMRLLENNPVVAAFGVYHYHQNYPSSDYPVIEWDVYFPTPTSSSTVNDPSSNYLLKHTVVSHGTLFQTFLERIIGYSAHASILHESGGMTIPQWLEIFMECLQQMHLKNVPTSTHIITGSSSSSSSESVSSSSPSSIVSTLPLPLYRLYTSSTGPLLSVFLDIKSSGITSNQLSLFIQQLNSIGIHVWGIGSFIHQQIYPFPWLKQEINIQVAVQDILRAETKNAAGKEAAANIHTLPSIFLSSLRKESLDQQSPFVSSPSSPSALSHSSATEPSSRLTSPYIAASPIPFHIYTFASGIVQAVQKGTLPSSSHVLFNAGSLFRLSNSKNSSQWILDTVLVQRLKECTVKYQLSLGAYTQESHLDAATAAKMIEHFNQEKELYVYGLSYSNLPTYCASDIINMNGLPIPGWLRSIMEPRVD